MTQRRKFIKNIILGTGCVSVGYFGYKTVRPVETALKQILITDLDGLKVSLLDVDSYLATIMERNFFNFSFSQERLICLYNSFPFKHLPLPFKDRYNYLRSQVVGNFLLSTNFFMNKMDVNQEVHYSGTVYKISETTCINPFSILYYK